MARQLSFADEDLFDTFMDAFLASEPKGLSIRLVAKILDKIDSISEPKFPDIDPSVQGAERILMSVQRKLRPGENGILPTIILEDTEYDYTKDVVSQVQFKHWAAQRAARMLDWLDAAHKAELKVG